MPNSFSKEERVAWEQMIEGFEDRLVLSRNVNVYNTNARDMERSADTIWRPMPYIMQSFSGTDMTNNFKSATQLSVPATLGFGQGVPWTMTARELRDALQENRLLSAAKDKLASDINIALSNVAGLQGTIVVKRTTAASGYDDLAAADSAMTEVGIQGDDRYALLHTRDYNNMASNLAGRQTMAGKPTTAYESGYVGNVADFETFKGGYTYRLAAAAGTSVTANGANQYYTPKATSTAVTGETANVDNRFQALAITVGSGTVKAGDAFIIAGVGSVHHITKADTGQQKTFRIISQVSGSAGGSGTYLVSPPIISGGGGTDAEMQYKNVTATPANGAAITFLNTAACNVAPFWHKDAIELLPGRYAVPENSGAAVMRATTEQGIELVFQKWYDVKTMNTLFRVDTMFGVVNKQPQMSGVLLFSQT